jgi:hypothetical protein
MKIYNENLRRTMNNGTHATWVVSFYFLIGRYRLIAT